MVYSVLEFSKNEWVHSGPIGSYPVYQTLRRKKNHSLIVYIDDIVHIRNHGEVTERVKDLSKEFEMKDLGNLKYFLGMEFTRSSLGISISQKKYLIDLLRN